MPLAWVEFSATPTDADFDAYIGFLDQVLAQKTPHVTVVKFRTGGQRLSTSQLGRSSRWVTDNTDAITAHCHGLAMVFDNMALRFVLSSFLLVTRIPTAYAVCATDDEALTWAASRLGLPSLLPVA